MSAVTVTFTLRNAITSSFASGVQVQVTSAVGGRAPSVTNTTANTLGLVSLSLTKPSSSLAVYVYRIEFADGQFFYLPVRTLEDPIDLGELPFFPQGVIGATADISAAVALVRNVVGVDGSQATGMIVFSAKPSNNQTVVINGVTVTFKTIAGAFPEVLLGADLAETLSNLTIALNNTSNASIVVASYADDGVNTLTVTYKAVGTVGNDFTLGAGTGPTTPSGTHLSGGTNSTFTPSVRTVTDTTDKITATDNNGIINYSTAAPCAVTYLGPIPTGFNCLWINSGAAIPTFNSGNFTNRAAKYASAGQGAMGSIASPDGTNLYLGGDLA